VTNKKPSAGRWGGRVLAAVSMFLPWVDVGVLQGRGFQNKAVVWLLAPFVYPCAMAFVNGPLIKGLAMLCGIVPGVYVVYLAASLWPVASWGMLVFFAACVLLIAAVPRYTRADG